jgi:hypothetical protein
MVLRFEEGFSDPESALELGEHIVFIVVFAVSFSFDMDPDVMEPDLGQERVLLLHQSEYLLFVGHSFLN